MGDSDDGLSRKVAPVPVSVLGLGYMGTAIAKTFIKRGYSVSVWNRTLGKADSLVALGAKACSTAEECIKASQLVIFVSTGSEAFKAIFGFLGESVGTGRTIIDFGTGTPSQVQESMNLAQQQSFVAYIHGVLLAMPVSIGEPDATAIYSGPREAYMEAESVLRALGRPIYLDEDPLRAPLQESMLGAFYYAVCAGYLQSVALLKRSNLWSPGSRTAEKFTTEFIIPSLDGMHASLVDAARQIDQGQYTTNLLGCRIANHLASLQTYMETFHDMGAHPLGMPAFAKVIQQRISEGGQDEEMSTLVNLL